MWDLCYGRRSNTKQKGKKYQLEIQTMKKIKQNDVTELLKDHFRLMDQEVTYAKIEVKGR